MEKTFKVPDSLSLLLKKANSLLPFTDRREAMYCSTYTVNKVSHSLNIKTYLQLKNEVTCNLRMFKFLDVIGAGDLSNGQLVLIYDDNLKINQHLKHIFSAAEAALIDVIEQMSTHASTYKNVLNV